MVGMAVSGVMIDFGMELIITNASGRQLLSRLTPSPLQIEDSPRTVLLEK
jgi:hypothetical protein